MCLFLAGVLSISLMAQAEAPQSRTIDTKQPTNTAQQQVPGNSRGNVSVGSRDKIEPPAQPNQANIYDPTKDTLYRRYLYATIIGVFVGFVGMGILVWQTVVTRRSANAAKDAAIAAKNSAQAVINSERPWIFVTFKAAGSFDIPREAHIYFSGKNCGRTPARVTRASVNSYTQSRDAEFYDEPPYHKTELKYPRYVPPDGTFEIDDFDLRVERNDSMWEDMNKKNERVMFTGHVVYFDLITGEEHESRFCYFLSPNPYVGLIMTGPRTYNKHT
jgi:hypothetical protein